MRLFSKKPPYTKQVAITPPRPDPNRHGIAVVTHLKNEASYITEWIQFHRAVGVRHFYIYDNGSVDGTQDILHALLGPESLTVIPWKFSLVDVRNDQILNSQVIAFSHAILNFGAGYKWMAFIDTDEFLLPKAGTTIEEALAHVNDFPNISLPWHMFGRGGHSKRPQGPVLLNYTRRSADPMSRLKNASNFKCIVDPCRVSEVSVHHFETTEHGDRTSNDAGDIHARKDRKTARFYSARNLQLNHYYTKSDEELRSKLDRGPASPASRERYTKRVLTAVESIEKEEVDDIAMVDFVQKNNIALTS